MHIAWGSPLIVFLVSFAAAVAVVVLVSFALVSVSPRITANLGGGGGVAAVPVSNKAIAGICITAAGLIVLCGLYVIVAA